MCFMLYEKWIWLKRINQWKTIVPAIIVIIVLIVSITQFTKDESQDMDIQQFDIDVYRVNLNRLLTLLSIMTLVITFCFYLQSVGIGTSSLHVCWTSFNWSLLQIFLLNYFFIKTFWKRICFKPIHHVIYLTVYSVTSREWTGTWAILCHQDTGSPCVRGEIIVFTCLPGMVRP